MGLTYDYQVIGSDRLTVFDSVQAEFVLATYELIKSNSERYSSLLRGLVSLKTHPNEKEQPSGPTDKVKAFFQAWNRKLQE